MEMRGEGEHSAVSCQSRGKRKERRGRLGREKEGKGGGGPVERDVERSRMEPGGWQLRTSSGNR
jgi:hypothetical protein